MIYNTLKTKQRGSVNFIQFNRPEAKNAINSELVKELTDALNQCQSDSTVVVLEGGADFFCIGADFAEIEEVFLKDNSASGQIEALYDLWNTLATGPFVSIAHVEGEAMAGGVGFVASCDIAIASKKATFCLPEMIFGLMPAAVLPFLIKRTGQQNAHLMTLLTNTLSATEAENIGLIDFVDVDSRDTLRSNLLRIKRLDKTTIHRYKTYRSVLLGKELMKARENVFRASLKMFSDPSNIERITHFNKTGNVLKRGSLE